MRVIKYRGKTKSTPRCPSKWFYGGVCCNELSKKSYIMVSLSNYKEVYPGTVSQYSEYQDTDGTEIYEGDFIQNVDQPEKVYGVAIVDGCWVGCSPGAGTHNPQLLNWLLTYARYKVIGNIWDTPEVFKEAIKK